MPEGAVIPDPILVGIDAVGVEQLVLLAFTEVPVEAQRRDGEVGPAVTDGKITEVDVAGPRSVDAMSVFGAQASPCTSTGSQYGGRGPSDGGWRPTHTCEVQPGGKSSMLTAWMARSPSRWLRSPRCGVRAKCRRQRARPATPP